MGSDWELGFADESGRYFARMHGMSPMTGRVVGWLLVCDPQSQTIADIAAALHASRSAVTGSAAELESWSWIRRFRTAGERMDRLSLDPDIWTRLIDNPAEYTALSALADRGLAAMGDLPTERQQRLTELKLFAAFVSERVPALAAEWRAERAAAGRKATRGSGSRGTAASPSRTPKGAARGRRT